MAGNIASSTKYKISSLNYITVHKENMITKISKLLMQIYLFCYTQIGIYWYIGIFLILLTKKKKKQIDRLMKKILKHHTIILYLKLLRLR